MRVVLVANSTCVRCGVSLAAGTQATYSADRGHTCDDCAPPHQVAVPGGPLLDGPVLGIPGGSATREYRRRAANREEQVRAKLGNALGGIYLALSDEPQSTRAWATGGSGERAVGARLDGRAGADFVVLHDRRIPGTRANVDHIVVTCDGVFIIDTKRYRGEVRQVNRGNLLFPDRRLYVGKRDCARLIDGVLWQAKCVRRALHTSSAPDSPIVPILCFVGAEWPLFAAPFCFDDVRVVWSKGLVRLIERMQTKARLHTVQLAADLHQALPPA